MRGISKYSFNVLPILYLSISFCGLCLLAVLTLFVQLSVASFPLQKPLVVTIFVIICFLGILAGISPTRCSNIFDVKGFKNDSPYSSNSIGKGETKFDIVGHHPTCGKFTNHVISFANRTYCAGCTGLIAGAVTSILGSFLYFFVSPIDITICIQFFWLGFVLVLLAIFQHNLYILGKSSIHLFLNIIFPVGALFLVIGVNEITDNFFLDFFLFALIIYWISTRIILSKVEHRKICKDCDIVFCGISKKEKGHRLPE